MDFLQHIIDFFNYLIDYLTSGIYDFFTQAFAEFIIWATVAAIKFKIFMIGFAWDVAQQIISELNLSGYINNAFASLDGDIYSAALFFRLPEAVNILMSAYVTRFVLNFIGL